MDSAGVLLGVPASAGVSLLGSEGLETLDGVELLPSFFSFTVFLLFFVSFTVLEGVPFLSGAGLSAAFLGSGFEGAGADLGATLPIGLADDDAPDFFVCVFLACRLWSVQVGTLNISTVTSLSSPSKTLG